LRYGERGEFFLIEPTGERGKAGKWITDQYRFCRWPGDHAYVPSLFIGSGLRCFFDRTLGAPELRRDALSLLLNLYARTDYAGYIGASPDEFPHQVWDVSGTRHLGEFDLGKMEEAGNCEMWLVSPPEGEQWSCPSGLAGDLVGLQDADADRRMWAALEFLMDNDLVSKVCVVEHDAGTYPLWFFGSAARTAYRDRFDIDTGLAASLANMACRTGIDPDNLLMRKAKDEVNGTGLYYCLRVGRRSPLSVYTTVCPVLYAPTKENLKGLAHVKEATDEITARIVTVEEAIRDVA
jgi:hypothetical protein